MKRKYITFGLQRMLVLFLTLAMFPACEERWEEMNTDPNQLSSLSDEYLFTNAVRQTFRDQFERFDIDFGGQFGHIWISNSWNREADKYNDIQSQGDIYERVFHGVYNGPIRNIVEVMQMTGPGGDYENPARYAQVSILGVLNFSRLTDFFGDIPYFEGGMGKYDILLPKYDEQRLIYADMIEQLEAIRSTISIGNPDDAFPGQDPMYNNDLEKWERFVNSLRLRLAMRARFADSGKYNAVIADCLTKPLIEDNSQNASLQHWDSERGELYNPWYNLKTDYMADTYQYNVSTTLVDWLKDNNDPRIEALINPNKDGEYIGMPNGLVDAALSNYVRSNISVPGDLMLAPDQPLDIMAASEIWFLRAEAALFNLGGNDDPNELYQKGIEQSMARWEIDATDYISNSPLANLIGSDEEKFEQIATQMWIAFVPNHQEAWSNIRRTGYPVIPQRTNPLLSKGVTNGYLPKRLVYPYTVEKSLNGANMQVAIDRMGGEDKIDMPVWWDARD